VTEKLITIKTFSISGKCKGPFNLLIEAQNKSRLKRQKRSLLGVSGGKEINLLNAIKKTTIICVNIQGAP